MTGLCDQEPVVAAVERLAGRDVLACISNL
jgi:hypothetical protein